MKRLVLAFALVACSKSQPAGPMARDAVINAWKNGGLETTEFATTSSPVGKDCSIGTVGKLDVLVCTYASADEAKQAANLGYQWVGDTSGKSEARGAAVIAVADRHKLDLHGKTMNQIYKLAPN
jgi:hypothetical protein